MLKHTFIFLPGVGARFEGHLWSEGIFRWQDFLNTKHIRGLSEDRKDQLDRGLTDGLYALERQDIDFFARRMNPSEHWRLFDYFRKDAVCLDIETTGGPPMEDSVTVVGLYGNDKMNTLIKDINLTPETLKDILSCYKLIITYYGKVFDVPFLNKSIYGLNITMPNYDLCFASHKLGIKGGFKKLETHFGIYRDDGIKGMDGYDAVKLWRRYQRGETNALELLVRYNEADTKNLYTIAETLYEMSIKQYGPPSFAGGLG